MSTLLSRPQARRWPSGRNASLGNFQPVCSLEPASNGKDSRGAFLSPSAVGQVPDVDFSPHPSPGLIKTAAGCQALAVRAEYDFQDIALRRKDDTGRAVGLVLDLLPPAPGGHEQDDAEPKQDEPNGRFRP